MNDVIDNQAKPFGKVMQQEIRYHWRRTGIGAQQFLQLQGSVIPDGLTADILNDWIAQRATHVYVRYWQFVIERWSALPNNLGKTETTVHPSRSVGHPKNVPGTRRIELTDDMHSLFVREMKRTGANIKIDIVGAQGAPCDLNERVVTIIKYRSAKTVRDDYWSFIIARLAALPDQVKGNRKPQETAPPR